MKIASRYEETIITEIDVSHICVRIIFVRALEGKVHDVRISK